MFLIDMIRFIRYVSMSVIIIFSTSLMAQTYYRADERPPVNADGTPGIFTTGFHPWGENDNLLEHVEGESLGYSAGPAGSAFVATTVSIYAALGMATEHEFNTFYIYEVRPSDNFYSVVRTFDSWRYDDPGYNEPYNDFGAQQEYAAYGGIPPSQIIRATLYTVVNGRAVASQVFDNPDYVRADTTANIGVYPRMYPYQMDTPFTVAYLCARQHNISHSDAAHHSPRTEEEDISKRMDACNKMYMSSLFNTDFTN